MQIKALLHWIYAVKAWAVVPHIQMNQAPLSTFQHWQRHRQDWLLAQEGGFGALRAKCRGRLGKERGPCQGEPFQRLPEGLAWISCPAQETGSLLRSVLARHVQPRCKGMAQPAAFSNEQRSFIQKTLATSSSFSTQSPARSSRALDAGVGFQLQPCVSAVYFNGPRKWAQHTELTTNWLKPDVVKKTFSKFNGTWMVSACPRIIWLLCPSLPQ